MTTERDRIQARTEAEAQQVVKETRIDLTAFLALKGEARAARWRQWDRTSKMDAIIQQFNRLQIDWDAAAVDAQIAKYDAKYTAGPVELAVEGALERLALEHSNTARLADRLGDKAHRKAERAAATAFTNALVQYKAGVRPELLPSGAWLIPSSKLGKPAHIVRMDGDWVCSCCAGANMHWPIAMVIGIEVSHDDMQRFDDPPCEPTPAELGQRLAAARSRYLEAA